MSTRTTGTALTCFVLLASTFLPLAAQAEETFNAGIARTTGVTSGRSNMPSSLIMTVKEWSTPEERANLLSALQEGGEEGLLDALREMDKGFLRYPASTGWPINHAWSEETAEGRIVRLITERPILFGEVYHNSRTLKYAFGVIELRLGPDGKGEGVMVPTMKVSLTEDGTIEMENFGISGHRLLNVTARTKKK